MANLGSWKAKEKRFEEKNLKTLILSSKKVIIVAKRESQSEREIIEKFVEELCYQKKDGVMARF